MTTIFTQNDNFDHFEWRSFCAFAQLVSTCIFFSAISHVLNGTTLENQHRNRGPTRQLDINVIALGALKSWNTFCIWHFFFKVKLFSFLLFFFLGFRNTGWKTSLCWFFIDSALGIPIQIGSRTMNIPSFSWCIYRRTPDFCWSSILRTQYSCNKINKTWIQIFPPKLKWLFLQYLPSDANVTNSNSF